MSADDKAQVPELPRADVTLLFDWDYYDGPLTGAMEWQGRRYWFNAVFEEEQDYPDLYEVHELTSDQWALIDDVNALFRELVGTHHDRDPITQTRDLRGIREDHGAGLVAFSQDPRVNAWKNPEGKVVAVFRLDGPHFAMPEPDEDAR